MAEEMWNKVNIPFPGAVSSVRINLTSTADELVANALLENESVLRLVDNETLQTEIRVLYVLLYRLNNSYKGNKSYKGLQQVEQCVSRLKNMKLVEALREFTQLCPGRLQRKLGRASGECNMPSQPMLEWLCLKVLGASHLMNQTLQRCTRAFLLCNQQMKVDEFLVLNTVETSMISRLWVIFRGVLVSLSALYQTMVRLCSEVAERKPMPFLKSPLPPNLSEILDPALLHDETCKGNVEEHPSKKRRRKPKKEVKEDLGVSLRRDTNDNSDLKPFVNIFKTFTKKLHPAHERKPNGIASQTRWLKNNVYKSTSFSNIDVHLEKMVQWCKLKNMGKKRRLFNYLRLKCKKMKCLESEGHNVERRLNNFRREVFNTCSKRFVPQRTRGSLGSFRRNTQTKTTFHSNRCRLASKKVKTGARNQEMKEKKSRKSKSSRRHQDRDRRTEDRAIPQSSHCDRRDDIDDIFSSIGL